MESRKIYFKTDKQLNKVQREFVENFFEEKLHTPLHIKKNPKPKPKLKNSIC